MIGYFVEVFLGQTILIAAVNAQMGVIIVAFELSKDFLEKLHKERGKNRRPRPNFSYLRIKAGPQLCICHSSRNGCKPVLANAKMSPGPATPEANAR